MKIILKNLSLQNNLNYQLFKTPKLPFIKIFSNTINKKETDND